MRFNLGAIICFFKDSHDVSNCDEDVLYEIKNMPESGVTTKCKRCGHELNLKIDEEDRDYYWITESDL